MTAEDAILDYYEALRRGEPLYPYFRETSDAWKAAISTTYEGYDAIAEGLREQSRSTTDWTVESNALAVVERDDWARMTDDVTLAWTRVPDGDDAADGASGTGDDEENRDRREHETRWSGVLVEHDDEWVFEQLHVSTASPA
jgi:hypothetical protein